MNYKHKIVKASPKSRSLVISGPGTGKTHCLLERIKHLFSEEHLNPATDILILSFSVAAVNEIRNRLNKVVETDGSYRPILYTNIRTFDSFASHFMLRIDQDIELSGKDYDERIQMAAEIIQKEDEARRHLNKFKHIMVDEIQDLVGARARLTQAILDNCEGGFTLFCDPAQAIYDYLVEEDSDGPTSNEFLSWLLDKKFENFGIIKEMKKNFRVGSNTNLEQTATEGRKLLVEGILSKDSDGAYEYLDKYFRRLNSLGRLNDSQISKEFCNPDTAILCRTNGQLLCLARNLHMRNIMFSSRRRNEERVIPPWIGRILFRWPHSVIQKSQFEELFSEKCEGNQLTREEAWDQLKQTEGGRQKNSINIYNLRTNLIHEAIFIEPARRKDNHGILLSTIHRAKGREFDRVIVVMPDIPIKNGEAGSQEARILYVAMTRARNELFRISEKGSKGCFKIKCQDRWVRAFQTKFTGIEIGIENDIDPHSFVSTVVHEEDIEDIRENQEDLWYKIHAGSEAMLSLDTIKNGNPIYTIKIKINENFITVGATSKKFGQSLFGCLKEINQRAVHRTNFPKTIDHIWVKDVVTEVGDLSKDEVPREYRDTGIWLGLRLEGLGQCHW